MVDATTIKEQGHHAHPSTPDTTGSPLWLMDSGSDLYLFRGCREDVFLEAAPYFGGDIDPFTWHLPDSWTLRQVSDDDIARLDFFDLS